MLEFPSEWRFGDPGGIAPDTVNDFYHLILKIAGQGDTWTLLELFKSKFNGGSSSSSSESWAMSDLHGAMHGADSNAPAFIDAFWSGREEIAVSHPRHGLPDVAVVNRMLSERGELYEIRPPRLLRRDSAAPMPVQVPAVGFDERARDLIDASLDQAERLMSEGRDRQAVQEVLWLLETVTTGFEGRPIGDGAVVVGKYFTTIARELRQRRRGSVLGEAMGWIGTLHGYLSSPTGGGVRHGTRLTDGVDPAPHEAALYVNLARSYIGFLLAELATIDHDKGGS